jgi:hypothetical protein
VAKPNFLIFLSVMLSSLFNKAKEVASLTIDKEYLPSIRSYEVQLEGGKTKVMESYENKYTEDDLEEEYFNLMVININ